MVMTGLECANCSQWSPYGTADNVQKYGECNFPGERIGSAMIQVYRYKAYDACFCAAPCEAIIATFGSIAQFKTFFGGGVTFGLPSSPEYMGVWGSRNSSRFRRLIREALGPIEIIDAEPPARMTTSGGNGHRLTRAEREAMILTLRN